MTVTPARAKTKGDTVNNRAAALQGIAQQHKVSIDNINTRVPDGSYLKNTKQIKHLPMTGASTTTDLRVFINELIVALWDSNLMA